MKKNEEIIVIGSCIHFGPNFIDVRFRGFYLGVELSLIRIYLQRNAHSLELNSEVVFRLKILCVSGDVLETRLVKFYSIE